MSEKPRLSRDNRALAGYIILEFAVTLFLLSILWGVLNEVVLQMEAFDLGIVPGSNGIEGETNPDSPAADFRRGKFFIDQLWEYTPVWGAVLVTLALQVAANKEGPRR
jgi:hypothetical protein